MFRVGAAAVWVGTLTIQRSLESPCFFVSSCSRGLHLTLKRTSELIPVPAPLVTRWLIKASSTLTRQSSLETDRSYELGLAAYHPRQEVTVATAQATQRKVGRKRTHNPNLPIQERLSPNLDCQAIAAGAKLCADRTAVLIARPPVERCVPVRAPRTQAPRLLTGSPFEVLSK